MKLSQSGWYHFGFTTKRNSRLVFILNVLPWFQSKAFVLCCSFYSKTRIFFPYCNSVTSLTYCYMNNSDSLLVLKQLCLPLNKPNNRSVRHTKHFSESKGVFVAVLQETFLSALTVDNLLLGCSGNDVAAVMDWGR